VPGAASNTVGVGLGAVAVAASTSFRVDVGPMLVSLPRPAFRGGVPDVVGGRAEEEMRDVYTRGIVAPVKHKKPIRNRTVDEYPGNAMGEKVLLVLGEYPVAASVSTGKPEVASVGRVALHVGIEALTGGVEICDSVRSHLRPPAASMVGVSGVPPPLALLSLSSSVGTD